MAIQTLAVSDELYRYMIDVSLRETDEMKSLREQTYEMVSRDLQSAPEQSQLMAFFLKVLGAKRAIEIGVYTGYSTLAMALALPENGKIIACDMNRDWTAMGRRYWKKAGVDHKIDLRIGPALDTLADLVADESQIAAYDFAYIDADKENNPVYVEECFNLLRTGGVIAIDNIFADGRIIDDSAHGQSIRTVRKMNRGLLHDDRFDLTLIPIGDGMTFLRKR